MVKRLIAMVGGVAMGLTASQFPEFSQQYEQRLGGAVEELRHVAEDFDASAADAGLTRQQALETYDDTQNNFLAQRGEDVTATLDRYERLETQLQALENANIVTRVTDFALYYDNDIGASALEAYNPAVPVTSEGFIYAGGGVLIGYILFALFGWAGARPFKRRRNRVRLDANR